MKHSDALQCCLLVLSMFDCGKGYNAENDEKHWAHQRVQMSHQSQAGFLFLEITEPSNLIVDMGRSIPAILNYTIPCQDKNRNYILGVQSSNNDVFVLKGNTTFEVTCEDAVEIDLIFSEQNVSVNEVVSYSTNHSLKTLAAKGSVRVDINGILLGIASMDVKLNNGDMSTSDVKESINGSVVAEKSFTVGVVRPITLVDQVFRIVIGVVISLVLLGFGCGLNLEVVKECLKKPIAPGIGLGCQYILMPLIGFTVAKLVPIENNAITFGIFVCGVCPGGGISNFYAYLLGGDVDLSITMTLISTVAALGMLPLWVYTLGKQFVNEDFEIFIPYITMLQTLAMITVPLFIGVFLKYKFPKAAIKFVKILKPVTIIIMLVVVTTGIISNLYIFKLFRPEYLFAGALLPYCGYIAGGVIAAILRQPWVRVKTIALETGMQNIGVAFIMMMMSFPPPLGDISALAPAAAAMMTPIPPLIITIPYLIYKRCTRKYDVVPALIDREVEVRKDDEDVKYSIDTGKERLNSNNDQKPMISDNLPSV